METDPHGHASLSLTASSAGTIELSAATQPPGGSAHATLFVSESGGDIPATPERLTLIPEAGEHHRGEETHLLVLAPFESGTVLLAFEPPVLPTQALAVHGYSGVVRLALPAGAGSFTVVAAFRGGRVITDRLTLLGPRSLPLAVRAVPDHATHPGARPAIALDTTDEAGHALASQVTLLASEAQPPTLAELLLRGQSSVAIADARPDDGLAFAAAQSRAPGHGALRSGPGRDRILPTGRLPADPIGAVSNGSPGVRAGWSRSQRDA